MRPIPLILLCIVASSCTSGDGPKDSPTTTDTPTDTGTLPSTDPACSGDAQVTLGTGQLAYEPLLDGDDLGFYLGPQGGYHVFVSVEATGVEGGKDALDPNNPRLSLLLTSGAVTLAEMVDQPRQLVGDDVVSLIGQLLIFSVADPPAYDNEPATLAWSLKDRCDREFSGTVDVKLQYVTE